MSNQSTHLLVAKISFNLKYSDMDSHICTTVLKVYIIKFFVSMYIYIFLLCLYMCVYIYVYIQVFIYYVYIHSSFKETSNARRNVYTRESKELS